MEPDRAEKPHFLTSKMGAALLVLKFYKFRAKYPFIFKVLHLQKTEMGTEKTEMGTEKTEMGTKDAS